MNFILDCSVTMSWCFSDEKNDYCDSVLNSFETNTALVPSLWFLEVVNVLLVAKKNNRVSEADGCRFIDLLDNLPIIENEDPIRFRHNNIFTIGREYGLSSYDSAYLDLAIYKDLPLATQDEALKIACKKIGVELYLSNYL